MNIILFKDIPKYLPRTDERAVHIRKILKLKTGDVFRAGILDGPAGEARIIAADDDGYTLEWTETGPSVGLYPLRLITGFVRPISAKRILREAASLGVGVLIFTVTDTGERSYLEANLWKTGEYRQYLVNGLQTAGATVVPKVRLCRGVQEALEAALGDPAGGPAGKPALEPAGEQAGGPAGEPAGGPTGGPAGKRPVRLLLDNVSGEGPLAGKNLKDRAVVLAVGSERGWSDRERMIFLEAGFEPIRIGSRVLRTETACTAGTALVLQGMGRL
ncbi:MAG: RsmE family RNA methyltransferase [Spirochaetota bacterium]|nr:RsmE family RNA methyltransferase [Spirochaetota bacterium]